LDEESCDVYKGKVQEEAEKWIKLAITAFEETLAKSKRLPWRMNGPKKHWRVSTDWIR